MERLNSNVSTGQAALKQRPKVLDAVGVDTTVNVLIGVVTKA